MSDIFGAGKGLGGGQGGFMGQFNLGHILQMLTGGGQYGGGFVGDMRGIGHSMMEHYRGGPQGNLTGVPNPIVPPALTNPGQQVGTAMAPSAVVPVGPGPGVTAPNFTPTGIPGQGFNLGQALALLGGKIG